MLCLTYMIVTFVAYVHSSAGICGNLTEDDKQADYYWRDYHGELPSDAVKGGRDVNGNVTYIGQAIVNDSNAILPGVLYPGKDTAVVGWHHKHETNRYVKVLCSRHIDHFSWVPTDVNSLHKLTDHHLVVGGYQTTRIMYICLVNYENNLIVGKAFGPPDTNIGCTIITPAGFGKTFDYYWRDYHGELPNDAVKGGRDVNGNVTYIGQAIVDDANAIIPGELYPGKDAAVVAWDGKHETNRYVKILCTRHIDHFTWVPIEAGSIHKLTDYHLVVGGYEHSRIMYICRLNYENNLIVGKAYGPPDANVGCTVVSRDGLERNFKQFEILGYVRC